MQAYGDAVLEGAQPNEIQALALLCERADAAIPIHIAQRLRAKGWIETFPNAYLVTIAGRTLVEQN